MASVFDRINGTTPDGPSEEIEGLFPCQEEDCIDFEDAAVYYPSRQEVRWTCGEAGHKNIVKDFEL